MTSGTDGSSETAASAASGGVLWVNPEYAEEFAVLSAWLSLLIPWSFTWATSTSGDATLFVMRFPAAMIQYVTGVPLSKAFQVKTPLVRRSQEVSAGNVGLAHGHEAWLVGTAFVLLAFALSLLLYFEVDAVDALPDPVRVMGGLLLGGGLAYLVADAFYWQYMPGTQIPVTTLFFLVFAAVLLTIDRPTEPSAGLDDPTEPTAAAEDPTKQGDAGDDGE
jgi:hypothetical protein